MSEPMIVRVTTTIDAPPARVWEALTNPDLIKRYLFGATATSDWKPGSPIRWTGDWQGRAYEDKGSVLDAQPGRLLRFTYFSQFSGLPDTPANYQTVTIHLSDEPPRTRLSLSQDNNPTEEARRHNEENWIKVLAGLKTVVEEH